ncbi:4-hydroxybenzoate octaprenyltransferase [Candidatus Magnetaquicoccus inordinatus]|uniref:4-hydroxybenzoate octaprenyltransferase n=1 Tax=Candidatus Magnetaquicoccus inordinatus TaxID=2496818 RepID=UPI00102AC5D9|nr:4-hydroxybenzoate octaprenyltransferase [Candidatus Magnetaquicoccus inordinatus]
MKHLNKYFRLMRVDKPIGTWLLLWPTLWSLFAAAHPNYPSLFLLSIFMLGSFLMRSAGCVINDIADRNFDPHVERTKSRPIASGEISATKAMFLLITLLGLALILALQLNNLALTLCPLGALLAVTYPYTKRIVHWPQFYLGTAFGWGVVIAWAAQSNQIEISTWLLFLSTLFWAAGYDTIYALMDIEDDIKIGVKSTAILFGRHVLLLTAILYCTFLLLLVWVGTLQNLSMIFYFIIALSALQMAWQIFMAKHKFFFKAFLSNKWLGALILLGFIIG